MTLLSLSSAIDYAKEEMKHFAISALEKEGLYLNAAGDYLLGTYPPLKAQGLVTEDDIFENVSDQVTLYLHIPFCEQYCTFCHFAKEINSGVARVNRYIRAIEDEIDLTATRLPFRKAITIFFGGGTPSYLSPQQIASLTQRLHAQLLLHSSPHCIEIDLAPAALSSAQNPKKPRTPAL